MSDGMNDMVAPPRGSAPAPKRKNLRCTKKRWCDRMEERLAPLANAREKGLIQLTLTRWKLDPAKGYQSTDRKAGVFYRKTTRDHGLMVNFCPWCGVNIVKLFGIKGRLA